MNFKKLLSDLGGWLLSGLTILGIIIIYAGIEAEETNMYFVAVGIVLILPLLIFIINVKIRSDKMEDDESKRINDLLQNGDIVTVRLDNLEIKSNSYQQEIEVGSGYRTRNEYIDVNHNVVLIEVPYKNETIKYNLHIDMDSTKLKMHFAVKKETELFVDPENPNNNYLDLQFLED